MIAVGQINVPQDEVEYSNKDMKLRINNSGYERGELIITKSEIAWKKNDTDSEGFSIPWDKIVVQAISSENQRSIYFMIDCLWPSSQQNAGDAPSNGDSTNGDHHNEPDENEEDEFVDCDDEVSDITEFWMVPDNRDEVDDIYFAMTRYPRHENMQESSDEGNFFDGEDMEQMNINDDERFADD